jgi:hypothetical protein
VDSQHVRPHQPVALKPQTTGREFQTPIAGFPLLLQRQPTIPPELSHDAGFLGQEGNLKVLRPQTEEAFIECTRFGTYPTYPAG